MSLGELIRFDRRAALVPWLTDELVLIVPLGHRIASRRVVRPQDPFKKQFIFREQGSVTRAVVAAHLRKSRIEAEAVMEMANPESVKNGLGIAIISALAVETELQAKTLRTVKIQGFQIRRELQIVYRRDKHLSPAAKAFIDMAQPGIPV